MTDRLIPELASHQRQFAANRDTAAEILADLSRAQFNWRPASRRWSIAECLVHLNVSARLFGTTILEAADAPHAAGVRGNGPFRYGALTRMLVHAVTPGHRGRYRAPKTLRPATTDHDAGTVLDEFRAAGRRWDLCLQRANGLDLARVKVPSPALAILKLPLGGMFAVQAMHERRHLAQARHVSESAGFPARP